MSQLVFGIDPREMFPAVLAPVEENVFRRLCELRDSLAQVDPPTPPISAKLALIHEAIHRLTLNSAKMHAD